MRPIKLGIAGATGAVGRIMCDILPGSSLQIAELKLLASERSLGKSVSVGERNCTVELLSPESIRGLDILISSTPDEIATEIAGWCQDAGVLLIDESGALRMREDVPLVVPEVNPHHAANHNGIIASPNCSTTQMVVCIKPLHDFANVRRVIVSTYQAASGAGSAAEQELFDSSQAGIDRSDFEPKAFTHPIAFNAIPQIGSAQQNGYTSEEMKMVVETQKILDAPDMKISATCVRIPVRRGHCESLIVECERGIDQGTARELFQNAPGITVIDDIAMNRYPVPTDCADQDDVFVGRIRNDLSATNSISFWCVSDNLRKGAATNALQIAELVARENILAAGP